MSAPLWTSAAALRLEGDKLIADNGGWMCESGTVDGYVFRFVWEGQWASCATPPMRETHDQARARLAADGSQFLVKPLAGRWVVECYAVTFSGAWGNEPAWAEWGRYAATDRETSPNRSNPVVVQAQAPPPPTPPPPPPAGVTLASAQAKASAALYELVEANRARGVNDESIRNTLYYELILAMGVSDQKVRYRIRDAIKGARGG